MPGILLLRKQIVKRLRRMFPGCAGPKPSAPLGFQLFLHREQASNVNILSSHTPGPTGGPSCSPPERMWRCDLQSGLVRRCRAEVKAETLVIISYSCQCAGQTI
jgi:hypothetical protein